jgi:hypothetical protein
VARVLGDHALGELVERGVALDVEQRVDEAAVLRPGRADQLGRRAASVWVRPSR